MMNAGLFTQTAGAKARGKLPEGADGEQQCRKSRRHGVKDEQQGRKDAGYKCGDED